MRATDFPEPDKPLIRTIFMILFVFFELCLMAFEEFFGAVFTAQLKDVIAHCSFNQYC